MARDGRHQSEDLEQEALFEWASFASVADPRLSLLFHIPNGGRRDAATGRALKRRGVKAGVPDLFLPAATSCFHGLFIEMKVGNNRPSKAQEGWIGDLKAQGYWVAICYGWLEAKETIEKYLRGYYGKFQLQQGNSRRKADG